ncbi:hypothetical protein BGZ57DRAFT_888957 [Hyaloscypha finlandica]|nr:hypothetical protein BGZ57DRAFT_888957 [Hyaloscypha finlandica]
MGRSLALNLDNAHARRSSLSSSNERSSSKSPKAVSSQTSSKESTHHTARRRGRRSRVCRHAGVIAATVVQGFSAAIISQYDASHTGHARHPLPQSICLPFLTNSCSAFVPLPKAILDPSSAVFANSVMVFGLAVLTSYGIQRENGIQDHILITGAILGFLISGLIAVFEGDGGAIKDYIPAFIMLSLLASMCGHE